MSNQAMTNDKQVEVWKEEFESLCEFYLNPAEPEYGDKGVYTQPWANDMLKGFLMAKRSMPPIELPKNYYSPDNFDVHGAAVEAFDSAIDDCKQAITAAGYSYRVKE